MRITLLIDRRSTEEQKRTALTSLAAEIPAGVVIEDLLTTENHAVLDAAATRIRRAAQPQGPFRIADPVPSKGGSAPDEVGGIELESLGDSREKPVCVVWTDELAAKPELNVYGVSDHSEFPTAKMCAEVFELQPRTVTQLLSQAKADGKKFAIVRRLYKVMTKENFENFLMENSSI